MFQQIVERGRTPQQSPQKMQLPRVGPIQLTSNRRRGQALIKEHPVTVTKQAVATSHI